MSVKYRFTS